MSTDSMSTHDWGAAESYLTRQLQDLPLQGFITIDAVGPSGSMASGASRRSGLFGWLKRPRPEARVHPLIQFLRDEEYLQAECSGPESELQAPTAYGWTTDQQDQLLALGWEAPDALDDMQMFRWSMTLHDPNSHVAVSPQSSATAAGLVVRTLRDVLGLDDPSGLQVTTDQFLR